MKILARRKVNDGHTAITAVLGERTDAVHRAFIDRRLTLAPRPNAHEAITLADGRTVGVVTSTLAWPYALEDAEDGALAVEALIETPFIDGIARAEVRLEPRPDGRWTVQTDDA